MRNPLLRVVTGLALCVVASGAQAQATATGTVQGVVRRPGGQPVVNASVELFETEERVTTDAEGRFRLRSAWTGRAMLVARHIGDPPATVEVTLPLDSIVIIVLPRGLPTLTEWRVRPAGEFRLASTTSSDALTPLDVVQTPGAAANVARALQIAPGVSNVDEGTGLFVRGGDVTETRVLVDDVVMLSPARFANPTGHVGATLNPFLLANATLAAGAFGAAYGNALSGVVRMETAGRPTRNTGSLTASIGSLSAGMALAATPRFGVRVLAELSDLGPLMNTFGRAQPFEPAPRGGDASVTLEYATTPHSRLKLFTLRQRQQFGVGAADLSMSGRYAATTTEDLSVLSWRDTSRAWRPSVSLGRSAFQRSEALTALDLGTALRVHHLVATLQRRPGTRVGVTLGVDHERLESRYTASDRSGTRVFDVDAPVIRSGAHSEVALRLASWAQLTSGVRADLSDFTERVTVDPRMALSMQLGTWGVVASAGRYHQIAEPMLVRTSVAEPMRVVQGTVAVERGRETGARLRVEAYARRWTSLYQFTPDFGVASGGRGDARGVDTELRWRFGERSTSRLVWSVLDARRTDARTGVLATAPMSITHSVTFVTQRELGRLTLGSAFRYASGRPFTDITGVSSTPAGIAPTFGAPNAERLPGYLRSDLSVSWLVARRRGPTAVLWASASNLFNRRNVMRYTWNADFTVRTPVLAPFNRSVYAGATLLLP